MHDLCVCVLSLAVSVLKRNCLGATQALEALALEEQERLAKERALDAIRFPGPSYRMSSSSGVAALPAVEPPSVAAAAAAMPLHSVPPQQFPGIAADEVAVPFILLGRANLKTGEVTMDKIHVKYVFNTIRYWSHTQPARHTRSSSAGRVIHLHSARLLTRSLFAAVSRARVSACSGWMSGCTVDALGVETEVGASALFAEMEARCAQRHIAEPIKAVRLELQAQWSRASLAVIARIEAPPKSPQPQPQRPQPQASVAYAAAAAIAVAAAAGAAAPPSVSRPFTPATNFSGGGLAPIDSVSAPSSSPSSPSPSTSPSPPSSPHKHPVGSNAAADPATAVRS